MSDYGLGVAQRQYDLAEPRYNAPEMHLCSYCGNHYPEYDMERIGLDWVCKDEVNDFCAAFVDDYSTEYIGKYAKEFYLDWWFKNLSDKQKVTVLQSYYRLKKLSERDDSAWSLTADADRKEFCLSDRSDWNEFVKERIGVERRGI